MLEVTGLLFAVAGFYGCFDRLRCINWTTTQPRIVLLYLAGAMWSLWIIWSAFTHGIEMYQVIGQAAVLACLICSRHRWRYGPPSTTTKPAPLGEPEVSGWN